METTSGNDLFGELTKDALALNATQACIVEVSKIQFSDDFRMMCEQNLCGSYNQNWMCPPAVGPLNELKEQVLAFDRGLLFQTVHPIEDSFDWEGMQEGKVNHEKIFRKILEHIQEKYPFKAILPLNAGQCMYCRKCAYLDKKKCYFPDKAVSSLEANGINVMDLVKYYGIPYKNGENTVSYVALILLT